jgi:hypothetical protein
MILVQLSAKQARNASETPWAKTHGILCFFVGFHPPKPIRSKPRAKARGFAEAGKDLEIRPIPKTVPVKYAHPNCVHDQREA